jgi:CRP-like cAMP-binding protein
MELNTLALAKHPFFEGLSERQLELLLDDAMQVTLKEDEIIFKEGEPANRFYLIQHGEVAIESQSEQYNEGGAPVRIDKIGAGEVLGWSWMFPPYIWHFDARAITTVKAIFFYGTRLRERCDQDPVFGHALTKRAAAVALQRLQATRKRLMERQDVRTTA